MPQKPLDVSTPLFYPRVEEQQASLPGKQLCDADAARIHKSVRVCSHMVHHKLPYGNVGHFFCCIFPGCCGLTVHHRGREQLAAEATAACGGNREPEQAQPDAITASRGPASSVPRGKNSPAAWRCTTSTASRQSRHARVVIRHTMTNIARSPVSQAQPWSHARNPTAVFRARESPR